MCPIAIFHCYIIRLVFAPHTSYINDWIVGRLPSLNSFSTMAKKSAVVFVATPGVAPKSTKKVRVTIPCALKFFWQFALEAWVNCRMHLAQFAAERPYFTETFIDEQETLIKSTKELPNNRTRVSMAREVNLALQAGRQSVSDEAQKLGKAIDYAYRNEPAVVAQVQRNEAGVTDFSAARPRNWGAVTSFIATANNYLTANEASLIAAGAINADFKANFEAVGSAFDATWFSYLTKRKLAKNGTQAVADAIEQIKLELDPMLRIGESIFKYDPVKRQLFTQEALVASVRSGHIAGVMGRVEWADNLRPIGGVLVEVQDEEGKTAITDQKGRFKIKVAAGTYSVRFSSEFTEPLVLQVEVEAGVDRRLNVQLVAMPVDTPAFNTSSLSESLKESVREVNETRSATALHLGNGVAVG